MADHFISREPASPSSVFASGATVGAAINISQSAFGNIYLPAEFSGDTISFQGAESDTGTFALIYDDTGTLVSFTAVSAKWHQLHPAVMGMAWIKPVTSVATSGAATALFSLKS